MSKYTIAIAGSTNHTVMCASALIDDGRFEISWIMTSSPRHVGRKQELVKNPLHQFAEKHGIQIVFVDKKIDTTLKAEVLQIASSSPDFLLVVDFGYLIPNWLLELPHIAPINVHPSDLPKYRGSSPGQFTLLYGESTSAISVIIMNDSLDEGDVIYQDIFNILSTFYIQDYYHSAFTQIAPKLPQILTDFAEKKIIAKAQPEQTPTPIARRLTREDGFIPWEFLSSIIDGSDHSSTLPADLSLLLIEAHAQITDWPQLIQNAVHALTPWPGVWTIVPTTKGEKRMKILEFENVEKKIVLKKVHIEGLQPTLYNEVQQLITQ